MAYAKPQITIDLEEYQELQKKAASQDTSLYQKALGIAIRVILDSANPSLGPAAVADLSAAGIMRAITQEWKDQSIDVDYRSGNCIVTPKTT